MASSPLLAGSLSASDLRTLWAVVRTGDSVGVKLAQDQLKRAGLYTGRIDGDAGPMTRGALDDAGAVAYGFRLDRTTLRLHGSQFFPGSWDKNLVVLHHTAGGTAASSLRSWNATSTRVGTAYLVERDGTVYEVMPPEAWAGHLGLGGSIEKRSVGIEICNWGWLKPLTGGRFAAWPRDRNGRPTVTLPSTDVLVEAWRGESAWERYPDAQLTASIALTRYLVARFGIDPDVAPGIFDTPAASAPGWGVDYERFKRFQGVISHGHVRRDKTDVHVGFPWAQLTQAVERGPVPPGPPPSTPPAPGPTAPVCR